MLGGTSHVDSRKGSLSMGEISGCSGKLEMWTKGLALMCRVGTK